VPPLYDNGTYPAFTPTATQPPYDDEFLGPLEVFNLFFIINNVIIYIGIGAPRVVSSPSPQKIFFFQNLEASRSLARWVAIMEGIGTVCDRKSK
jgi:hypothetical protein